MPQSRLSEVKSPHSLGLHLGIKSVRFYWTVVTGHRHSAHELLGFCDLFFQACLGLSSTAWNCTILTLSQWVPELPGLSESSEILLGSLEPP